MHQKRANAAECRHLSPTGNIFKHTHFRPGVEIKLQVSFISKAMGFGVSTPLNKPYQPLSSFQPHH